MAQDQDEFAPLTPSPNTESVNKVSNTYIEPTILKSKKVKMTNDNSTLSSLHLPASIKLKGKENYTVQKEQMLDLATSNQLKKYISEKARKLVFVDEDNKKANADKLEEQQIQESRDACIKLAISYNCQSTPQQVVIGKKTALEIQQALQIQYKGKGYVIKYNAIQKYITLKYKDFIDLTSFIIAYQTSIKKMSTLKISSLDEWYSMMFIAALSFAWPVQAKR